MIRIQNADNRRYRHRSELALYRRCRHGATDALRAMLYRSADRWYTAAMLVCHDESVAAETVREVWDLVVRKLSSWRFGGEMDPRSRAILRRLLVRHSTAQQALKATETARQMATEELIPLPDAVMDELLSGVTPAAACIASAHERRVRGRRAARTLSVPLALVAAGILIWNLMLASQISSTQLAWQCIKERVERQDMAGTIADVLGEIVVADQHGTEGAEMLQRAGLVTEEIANASPTASLTMMHYLGERSRADNLAEELTAISDRYSGAMRQELMMVALAFEEVENW